MKASLSIVRSEYDFEIDKGIAIPPKESRSRYPFALMKVGDSFFVEGTGRSLGSCISSAIRLRVRSHPEERYTRRKKANGIRVWRIS